MHGSLAQRDHHQDNALVDACVLPITLKLIEGYAHDGRTASDLLEAIGAGQILLADRSYDTDELRCRLKERGAWTNIKPMRGQRRIPTFNCFLYRNLVERFFTSSNTSGTSRHDITNAKTTFLPPSNALHSGSGAGFMSRCPYRLAVALVTTPAGATPGNRTVSLTSSASVRSRSTEARRRP